jgi:hypothetical protein
VSAADVLRSVEWSADRVRVAGLDLLQESARARGVPRGDTDLVLYKTPELVTQYAGYFATHPVEPGAHLLELGIWDGGSVAFWHEVLAPARHAAVDLATRGDPPAMTAYASGRPITTRWGVDQADAAALHDVVRDALGGRLDLVVDDASHLYAPTKASFEALFPLLPPGGTYVIEDWAWSHWPEFHAPDHVWRDERPLTDLVVELVELAGSTLGVVEDVVVRQGFTAVRRGSAPLPDPFRIDGLVVRRPDAGPAPASPGTPPRRWRAGRRG